MTVATETEIISGSPERTPESRTARSFSSTEKDLPVLLFGDYLAAYGAIRGLAVRRIPIHLVCRNKYCLAAHSRFINLRFVLDPFAPDFLDRVYEISDIIGGDAVVMVAGDDDYLDVLSRNKGLLPDNFRCTFHGREIVDTIRNKHITYQKCAEIGVGYPRSIYIESFSKLRKSLDEWDIPFPVILKSEYSSRLLAEYGIKGILAENTGEIVNLYRLYNGFYDRLLISEYIPGDEKFLVNLMAVGDPNGNAVEVFMNRKVRVEDRFRSCTLMESYYSEELYKQSIKLMSHLGYLGYFNPEFKVDPRDGTLKLMEVNGRITVSNSHALTCGLNLPLAMYDIARGNNGISRVYRPEGDERTLWWAPVPDMFSGLRMMRQRMISLNEYLHSLKAAQTIIEPFWWKDPAVGVFHLINNGFKKGMGELWRYLIRR